MNKSNIIKTAALCALLAGTTGAWAFDNSNADSNVRKVVAVEKKPLKSTSMTTTEKAGPFGKREERKERKEQRKEERKEKINEKKTTETTTN